MLGVIRVSNTKAEQPRPASLANGSEDLSQAAWFGGLTRYFLASQGKFVVW
jgi:hypothetical protein